MAIMYRDVLYADFAAVRRSGALIGDAAIAAKARFIAIYLGSL
ncbi:MAG: hypothetical protein O7D36_07135 [Gammaproteobacteria bacterium]|nr:hypothetical protein [Gammaproteobacteria bacterium]